MDQDTQDHFDLPALFAVLQRQMRLIVLLAIVVMACAFLYVVRATPLYTATALIRVDPQETNLLDPNGASIMSSSNESTRIETEVETLRTSSLAMKTIVQEGLQASKEFGPRVGIVDKFRAALGIELPPIPSGDILLFETLSKFENALTVRRKGLTYLVSIQFTTESPEQSANAANAHARTYIKAQISDRVESSLAARDVLQSQLEQARQRLAQSNQALRAYIEQNAERLASETGSEELSDLVVELRTVTENLGNGEDSLAKARLALENDNWTSLKESLGDSALQSLKRQREVLASQLSGSTQSNKTAFDLAEGLEAIDREIADRSQVILTGLQRNVSQNQSSRKDLLETVQGKVLASELSARTLSDIYQLQQEAQIAQRQYDQLISRMRDIEAQAVLQVASSRLISEAIAPVRASFPNKKIVLAIAALGALGLGIGVALLKEFYFGGVTSSSQLSNIIPVKVSTVVPKLSFQGSQVAISDRVITEPMSQFAESFRKLRASVDQSIVANKDLSRVILVTSAIPAEGKSTTALSLARTYAQAGKRTLLIDADLRNPSIHRAIGETPEYGLMDYLMTESAGKTSPSSDDQERVREFYVLDRLSKLGVVLGSKRANTPTDAPLQSKAFHDLINETRSTFDVVIIDTAPLLPVVDTQYIAPLVDTAVLCVRFGEASQLELRTAFHHLADSLPPEASIVSVLNFFEGSRQGYRYGGYYS